MCVEFKAIQNDIEKDLSAMLTRSNTMDHYLNTVLFRQYQKAQIKRWQTENASETGTWRRLQPAYAKAKLRRYAGFPGGGKVMMIATNRLSRATFGIGEGFRKIVSSTQAIFAVDGGTIGYAGYAADDRPYMEFSEETETMFKDGITRFITKGRV